MPTRNVVLTDHQARYAQNLVAAGRYQNVSEVLREGLRLIERNESEADLLLQALRAAVAVGAADMQTGAYRSFESATALGDYLAVAADEAMAP